MAFVDIDLGDRDMFRVYICMLWLCLGNSNVGGRVEVENRLLSRVSLLQKCRAVLVLNLYVYSRLEEREKKIYLIAGRQIVSGNFVEVDIELKVSLAEGLRARFVQGVLAVGVHSSAIACGMISTKFDICIDAEYESDSSTSLSWGCWVCGCLKIGRSRGKRSSRYIFVLAFCPPAVRTTHSSKLQPQLDNDHGTMTWAEHNCISTMDGTMIGSFVFTPPLDQLREERHHVSITRWTHAIRHNCICKCSLRRP